MRTVSQVNDFYDGGASALKTFCCIRKGVKMVNNRTLVECLDLLEISRGVSLGMAKPDPENKPIVIWEVDGIYWSVPSASNPGMRHSVRKDLSFCSCAGFGYHKTCRHIQMIKDLGLTQKKEKQKT